MGIVSLAVLAVAIVARYWFRLAGAWRPTYVICAAAALYLNVFVLVVQAFLKVPQLNAVAPRQTEPVFLLAEGTNIPQLKRGVPLPRSMPLLIRMLLPSSIPFDSICQLPKSIPLPVTIPLPSTIPVP